MEQITQILGSRVTTGLAISVAYVTLCRGLRFLRRDRKHAQSPYKSRDDFKKMTAEDAFQIVDYIQGREFPWISTKALAFALFKCVTDSPVKSPNHSNRVQNIWHPVHLQTIM
jgi:hypothetical protein